MRIVGWGLLAAVIAASSSAAAEGEVDGEAGAAVEAEARPIGYGMTPFTVAPTHAQVELAVANATWERDGDETTRTVALGGFDLKLGVSDRVDAEVNVQPWVVSDAGDGAGWGDGAMGDTTVRLKVNLTGHGGGFAAAIVPKLVVPTGDHMDAHGTAVGVAVPVWFELPGHVELIVGVDAVTVPEAEGADDLDLAANVCVARIIAGRLGGFVEGIAATSLRAGGHEYTAHVGASVALHDDAELDVAVMADALAPTHRLNPYLAITVRH